MVTAPTLHVSTTMPHTLHWQVAPKAGRTRQPGACFPTITAADVARISDGLDYWDAWPLLTRDGALYRRADGSAIWFALAASYDADIAVRHTTARIHMLAHDGVGFAPLGPAMPDNLSPGSREWSGSACIDPATLRVTLYFTATGRRGEHPPTWEQRLFVSGATLVADRLIGWDTPQELMAADGLMYRVANQAVGEAGKIKALRDPEYFRDPTDDSEWIVFTGSSATDPSDHDGVIGVAALRADGRATPLPPLIAAHGFNNELERPHIRVFDGRYYLFWSTQRYVFAPGNEQAPTGLYGAVADSMMGPWTLLNGDGLIAGNPESEPLQTYSWLVLPDRSITSFIDLWGIAGRDPADAALSRAQFGGTFAPFTHLIVGGACAHIAA